MFSKILFPKDIELLKFMSDFYPEWEYANRINREMSPESAVKSLGELHLRLRKLHDLNLVERMNIEEKDGLPAYEYKRVKWRPRFVRRPKDV